MNEITGFCDVEHYRCSAAPIHIRIDYSCCGGAVDAFVSVTGKDYSNTREFNCNRVVLACLANQDSAPKIVGLSAKRTKNHP